MINEWCLVSQYIYYMISMCIMCAYPVCIVVLWRLPMNYCLPINFTINNMYSIVEYAVVL